MELYHILLTKKFEIKSVVIMQKNTIRLCKKGMRKMVKDHEKSDYFCVDHSVTNHDLEKAARLACKSFDKWLDRFYPARYEGPDFSKSAPYFTYPVLKGAVFEKCN